MKQRYIINLDKERICVVSREDRWNFPEKMDDTSNINAQEYFTRNMTNANTDYEFYPDREI